MPEDDLRLRKKETQLGSSDLANGRPTDASPSGSDFPASSSRSSKFRSSPKASTLSVFHWVIITAFISALFVLSVYLDQRLPRPLPAAEAGADRFSEERARLHLEELVSYGPRPSGSEAAEVKARAFLLREIEKLKSQSNSAVHRFEVDVQKPSSCYDLDFLGGETLCYFNMTNIVVRFGPKKQPDHAVLMNCHFDSVPQGPGASDDAVSCTIMLELLSIFSKSSTPVTHDIIFLFNGAEENILQASHGFITQHPWRHSIKAFVNLEAAGAGGREMLFQAGPQSPWLLQTYLTHASRPHCTVIAQELFQNGLIMSDTDFRIFRDFGKIPGLDIAYIRNGYVYHTEFDIPAMITNGSIQRSGENLLSVVRALANSPYIAKPGAYNKEASVFFDLFGLILIYYPISVGQILNISVALLAFSKILANFFRRSRAQDSYAQDQVSYSLKELGVAILTHCLAAIMGVAVIVVCTKIVYAVGLCMFWYSKPYLLFPLYALPSLAAILYVHGRARDTYLQQRRDLWMIEKLYFDVATVMCASLLLYMTWHQLASAYLPLVYTIFLLARDLLRSVSWSKNHKNLHLLLHLGTQLVPSLMGCYGLYEVFAFFIPMMGRTGSVVNPETVVGGVMALGTVTCSLFLGSLVYVSRDMRSVAKSLFGLSVVCYLVVNFYWLGLPYAWSETAPTLRRLHLQHTSRHIYDLQGNVRHKDSGVWVVPMDYRGTGDLPMHAFLAASKAAGEACVVNDTWCGFPFYLPVSEIFLENSRYMLTPHGPKVVEYPLELKLLQEQKLAANRVNLTFVLSGPDYITLMLTPKNGWGIVEWSFTRRMFNQKEYFVSLASGSSPGKWSFWLLLEASRGMPAPSSGNNGSARVLVGVAGFCRHGPNMQSETVKGITDLAAIRRPQTHMAFGWWKWLVTISGWNSEYQSKEF